MNALFVNLNGRFDSLSVRERLMMAFAALAVLVLVWDQAAMAPLAAKRAQLTQTMEATRDASAALATTIENGANSNPTVQALAQKHAIQQSLASVDAELQSESAGLVTPQRMVEVLYDMLADLHGVRFIELRNLPVHSLLDSAANATKEASAPPYVHAFELEVEGSYLDILQYLRAVESLPWRLYWQVLELKTMDYPRNRVRIRLNTLSMDKEWLGV